MLFLLWDLCVGVGHFGVICVLYLLRYTKNNVRTLDDLQQLEQKNQMIRQFVHNWDHPTVQLLVLEFGQWIKSQNGMLVIWVC
jgi:hypothetical protein